MILSSKQPRKRAKRPCFVPGCHDKYAIRHRFPKEPEDFDVFKTWIERINNPKLAYLTKNEISEKGYVICDIHFTRDCRVPGTNKIKKRSVPTLHLPNYPPREDIDTSEIWPAGCVTDITEDPTNLQMVEDEILQNLNLFNPKFMDIPADSIEPGITQLHNNEETSNENTFPSQKFQSSMKDELDQETGLTFNMGLFEEVSHNLINPIPTLKEVQKDIEKEVLDLTAKPYFKSVKSFLQDSNRMAEVCRICFHSLLDDEVIKLYEETSKEDTRNIKNMLKLVLPDLDLDVYPNTVVCTNCVELLFYSCQLKEKWLLTEEKLQKIVQKKKGVVDRDADLIIIGKPAEGSEKIEPVKVLDHDYVDKLSQPNDKTTDDLTDSILHNLLTNNSSSKVSIFHGELNLFLEPKKVASVKKRPRDDTMWGLGPFMCELCGRFYKHKQQLKRHLRGHKEIETRKLKNKLKDRKNMCEICGKLFLTASTLKLHSRKHAEYKCTFCDKIFNQNFKLRDHIRYKHKGIRLQCHLCGKQFSYPTTLRVHLDLHNPAKKKRACHLCPKKFFAVSHLQRHLFTHVREKLLRCDYCGKSIKHEVSLRKHIQIYHKNQAKFVCEFCNRPYWKKVDLEKHRIRVHGFCSKDIPEKIYTERDISYSTEYLCA